MRGVGLKVAWAVAASMILAGSLWVLTPQRIEPRPTISRPARSGGASEIAVGKLSSAAVARMLLERGSADPRRSSTHPTNQQGGISDRERALAFIRELLAKMNDREIIDTVSGLTELDAEDFDDIRDVRRHVLRLAEIATGLPVPVSAEDTPVVFARSVDPDGQTVLEDLAFHDRVRAIYAVFPTDAPPSDAVYMKWQRTDASEPLHLDRHSIETSRDRNYVWLEPGDGWSEGTYQVEVYSADDELTPLAIGRFDIVPIDRFTPDGTGHGRKSATLTAAQ